MIILALLLAVSVVVLAFRLGAALDEAAHLRRLHATAVAELVHCQQQRAKLEADLHQVDRVLVQLAAPGPDVPKRVIH